MEYTYNFSSIARDLSEEFEVIRERLPFIVSYIPIGEPAINIKHEWMEKSLGPRVTALAAAVSNTTTVTFTLASGGTSVVAAGDVLRFERTTGESYSELVKVAAVATATVTVVRGHGGSTKCPLAADAVAVIAYSPKLQGTSAGDDDASDVSLQHNYTQIFARTAKVTRTAQAVRHHGIENALNFTVAEHLDTLARFLNNSVIYGRRVSSSSSAIPTEMGGLLYFIDNVAGNRTTAGATAITSAKLNQVIEDIIIDGGRPDTILCNTNQARRISSWNSSSVMTTLEDTRTGSYVQEFVSELGMLPGAGIQRIVVDMNFPKDKIMLLSSEDLALVPLNARSWFDMDASAAGADFVARRIVGEYTLEVRNALKNHGIVVNLAV